MNTAIGLFILIAIILASESTPAQTEQEINERLRSIRENHGVSAAAAIIVDQESVLLEHYSGISDRRHPEPVGRDSWFRAGSVTKAFTGLAMVRAEAMGLVRLDRPLLGQLPASERSWLFENPWEARQPLYLADLLEHTAGWFDMSQAEFDDKNPAPLSLEQSLKMRPASRVSHWRPGRHSVYSNSGPGLAAYTLELAAGQDFDSWIRQEVFKPLGMSATLLLEGPVIGQLVSGYNTDGKSVIPYWHIVFRPSGGMNVLPREMARFLWMMLNRGVLDGREVFSESQVRRIETPTRSLAARRGLSFGYGLGIYASVHRGRVLYGHGGDADGYLAHFAYSLEAQRGYFVVINAFNHKPLREMKRLLNDFLVQDLPWQEPPPPVTIGDELLASFAGSYQLAAIRFPRDGWREKQMTVRVEGDGLQLRKGEGRWQKLVPSGGGFFRRPADPVATRAFIELEDGSMVFQDPNDNWIKQKHIP
jgi:CubicO group peptidase (beta-lactamase class C family)